MEQQPIKLIGKDIGEALNTLTLLDQEIHFGSDTHFESNICVLDQKYILDQKIHFGS